MMHVLERVWPTLLVMLAGVAVALLFLAYDSSDPDYGQEVVRVGDVEWLCLERGGETVSCALVEEHG